MIKDEWGFKEVVENIETLKIEYNRFLASFCYFDKKSKLKYIQKIKKEIYSIKTLEWRKNILWNYLNSKDSKTFSRYLANKLDTK